MALLPASGRQQRRWLLTGKRIELCQRQRLAVQESLIGMAAGVGEQALLCDRFDPFGDDRQVQCLCKGDDGIDDGGVVGVAGDVPDEGLIDLQLVQWQQLQVGQR